jgi:hypothetical protein
VTVYIIFKEGEKVSGTNTSFFWFLTPFLRPDTFSSIDTTSRALGITTQKLSAY